MATVTKSTKKPTGLSIARAGRKHTLSWKIADEDYGAGQTLQYRLSTAPKKWINASVGSTTKSKTVSLTLSNFYPTTKKKLLWIEFRLCGRRSSYTSSGTTYTFTVSDYAVKRMTFSIPSRPTLKASLGSVDNVANFIWGVSTDTTDSKPFDHIQYQSILVASTETTGAKLKWKSSTNGWQTGTSTSSASTLSITEDSTALASSAYVRWVRIRSVGMAGVSEWRYAKHVYATPYAANIKSVSTTESSTTTTVYAKWSAKTDGLHPIDKTAMQYVITTPDTDFAVPSGASWSTISTTYDTGGTDAARGVISDTVGEDECLWVRILTYHDNSYAASSAKMAAVGSLTAPTLTSVVTDDSTFSATITATNNSAVTDSFMAVVYRAASSADEPVYVGIIPAGSTTVTVTCPDWSAEDGYSIGVKAVQGTYTLKGDYYAVVANMQSEIVDNGGSIPTAATSLAVTASDTSGEAILTWTWAWSEATAAEISWSTNPNAWESTSEPNTYIVTRLHNPLWRVSDLEVGVRWYFRVRLLSGTSEDDYTYAPYSDIVSLDLSSAPAIPVLALSQSVITDGGTVTASWEYTSTDGTAQAFAEIIDTDTEEIIAQQTTAHSIDIDAETVGWSTGETHYLAVRVTSASGNTSDWSDPAQVSIADPVTCSIESTGLSTVTITDDDSETRTVTALTVLPLSVTVSGAGDDDTTTLVIERAEDYEMDRPDESMTVGYEGETIYLSDQLGADAFSIEQDDLIGRLDDGAKYRLVATVSDTLGQSETAELDFEVHWTHQAIIPEGTAVIDSDELISVITPTAPDGYVDGDTCDIYRLSGDRPELIYADADFGTAYVDPYPAIGGGHRIVYKTVNGDYITADNEIAWLDISDPLEVTYNIIDFGKGRVILPYNIDLSSAWKKDFQSTSYLGGSVQGDWNPAVERSGSVGAVVVVSDDPETIEGLRRLATYPGICHVRTLDGSSYAADVQVSESRSYSTAGKIASFTLKITRVDSEDYDGMTYAEWIEEA